MSLTAWDCADIDAFATRCSHEGKPKANALFHGWANRQGWWMQPQWIPARTRFRAAHKAARAEYCAHMPEDTRNVPAVALGDWRPSSDRSEHA
jgi:hypothetical protein